MSRKPTLSRGPKNSAVGATAIILVILGGLFLEPLGLAARFMASKAAGLLILPLSHKEQARALNTILKRKNALPSWTELRVIHHYLGLTYWPLVALITLFILVRVNRTDVVLNYSNKHTLAQLLKISSKHYPCMVPVLKVGRIDLKPRFYGEWRLAETPIQFILERSLLLDPKAVPYRIWDLLNKKTGLPKLEQIGKGENNKLDKAKLAELIVNQLGPTFKGDPRELPFYQKALAAALIAHRLKEFETSTTIFNQLALSWNPKTHKVKSVEADRFLDRFYRQEGSSVFPQKMQLPDVRSLWDPYGLTPRLSLVLDNSRLNAPGRVFFLRVWFMELLRLAQIWGGVASSQWLWLKPSDRTLFYSLNQVGSPTAWIEAIGPYSHISNEVCHKIPKSEPMINNALKSVEQLLKKEGWLLSEPFETVLPTIAPPSQQATDSIVYIHGKPYALNDYNKAYGPNDFNQFSPLPPIELMETIKEDKERAGINKAKKSGKKENNGPEENNGKEEKNKKEEKIEKEEKSEKRKKIGSRPIKNKGP
jgi:hypothetical protein